MAHSFVSLICLPLIFGTAAHALAQPTASPVSSRIASTNPQAPSPTGEDISLDDYLALLARISPAAREGALAYMQAFQSYCGRAMSTTALRRAVSEGSGDPILMAMVRASHPSQQAGREATIRLLTQRIHCDSSSTP